MGSSTLSHIWKCNTLRPSVPLAMHCLIGGTVVEIHRMFLKDYGSYLEPLNVIFSCAINSIPLESAQQIITQMKCFNYSVKHLNKDNSVIFSTMSFPPKLCDSHNPYYQTNIQKIKTVNNWVEDFNRSNSGLSLNLASYGSLTVDGQVALKYDEWKEVNVNKKLHFSSDIKRKVAVDLSKLTETLSNLSTQQDGSSECDEYQPESLPPKVHSSPFPTDTIISPPPGFGLLVDYPTSGINLTTLFPTTLTTTSTNTLHYRSSLQLTTSSGFAPITSVIPPKVTTSASVPPVTSSTIPNPEPVVILSPGPVSPTSGTPNASD